MATETLYFWYSHKQAKRKKELYSNPIFQEEYFSAFVTLNIAGEMVEVEYTDCTKGPQPFGKWDDYVLLGVGSMDNVRVMKVTP